LLLLLLYWLTGPVGCILHIRLFLHWSKNRVLLFCMDLRIVLIKRIKNILTICTSISYGFVTIVCCFLHTVLVFVLSIGLSPLIWRSSGDHIMHSLPWVYSFCMACFLNTPDSDHLLLKRGLNKLSCVSERRNIQKCAEQRVPRIRIKKLQSKLFHLISVNKVIQVYLSLNLIKASWGFSYSNLPLVILRSWSLGQVSSSL